MGEERKGKEKEGKERTSRHVCPVMFQALPTPTVAKRRLVERYRLT